MDSVNKTLYIPLYGKSYVSKKRIILNDKQAEKIWDEVEFKLKRKSKSKYLAYFMASRAAVFDSWLKEKINEYNDAVILHIGCGMDSRVLRVGSINHKWYDIDFKAVIAERKKYYEENHNYKMIIGDAREANWLNEIEKSKRAIVVLEGISMYLANNELMDLLSNLSNCFDNLNILMDCYSVFAAKMSKYKNPINDVGVTKVYGLDDPKLIEANNVEFVNSHIMVPNCYINELRGIEKFIFKKLYAGKLSKKLYKLYEFKK